MLSSLPFVPALYGLAAAVAVLVVILSLHRIGPTDVGLVTKRYAFRRLEHENPIAFRGEAGYQADLLMPGLRWKLWPVYLVEKAPWVQVPAGEIGVVIAQVGRPLPEGAKSAVYRDVFGTFTDLRVFVEHGGQKGVQRPVLPPGTLAAIHPVAFLVITKNHTYGIPIAEEYAASARAKGGGLLPGAFNLHPEQLELVRIVPERCENGRDGMIDTIGIVTALEGPPLEKGSIAGRIGGFEDVHAMEAAGRADPEIIEAVLGSKNQEHNNYQSFQAFLDKGGRMGLQHDPLLYGAYALNPFLLKVEKVPMLVVRQGEVAVVKSFVGLPTQDTSGIDFKFGSIVRPGHRGIWQEPLRTGKYALNPRCYNAEIVPTAILTLNWAKAVSEAHKLDANLSPIDAKSKEGFEFRIDLQVQIHVPDTMAPRVISMVGTMKNLVDEVLQAAVGNHFRNTLQGMEAIQFIQTRERVQADALAYIERQIKDYHVETRGVYIQDVTLPDELVTVLRDREIARQEVETFRQQKLAQDQRTDKEKAEGIADQQKALAHSEVHITIKENDARARRAEADGEAWYTSETGRAKGAEVEAVGLARAKAYREQAAALGQGATAVVNVASALSEGRAKFVPDTLVVGGNGSASLDGALASLMGFLGGKPLPGHSGEPPANGGEGPKGQTAR